MDRSALDRFTSAHRLAAPAITTALTLSGARPDAPQWRAFAARALHAAGVAGLGAGLLFFVAANWQAWGLPGRFALLQAGLLLCVAAALWRAPPQRIGSAALLLAVLFTGGLLALFGQSYQTGADVHELFFTWALLALPFALAALSGAVWALWWTVLNAGLALLFGWLGTDHFFWRVIDGIGWSRASLLMLPCTINLLAAGGFLLLRRTRVAAAAPLWLPRCLATVGLGYGTAAMMLAVSGNASHHDTAAAGQGAAIAIAYSALSIVIAFGTWRRRQDVFPLTLLAGSWIAIATVGFASLARLDDIGTVFVLALWLIVSSTLASMGLMRWWRQWRALAVVQGAS